MPAVVLPSDFRNDSQLVANFNFSGVAALTGPNGKDRADIYIGLVLDGYKKYANISKPRPDIKLSYYTAPTLNCEEDLLFNPSNSKLISIPVNNRTF